MNPEKILLIDDDHDDQLFFLDAIRDIDATIVCEVANDGIEGIEKLKSEALPDLIFLDLNMPYMNGFDFLLLIRKEQQYDDIPVIIFTTSSHQRDIETSRELGAKAFLTKPNNFNELAKKLAALVKNEFLSLPEMQIL
jgi:CheY-like chemotaxis protein